MSDERFYFYHHTKAEAYGDGYYDAGDVPNAYGDGYHGEYADDQDRVGRDVVIHRAECRYVPSARQFVYVSGWDGPYVTFAAAEHAARQVVDDQEFGRVRLCKLCKPAYSSDLLARIRIDGLTPLHDGLGGMRLSLAYTSDREVFTAGKEAIKSLPVSERAWDAQRREWRLKYSGVMRLAKMIPAVGVAVARMAARHAAN